jgi:integrase/recombinase XerD
MQSLDFFDVKNISKSEVLIYLRELRKKKISDAEYALKVSKLKKYFQYLEKNDFIFISPLSDYKCSKYGTKSYPTLSQEEIENILEKIKIDHPLGLKSRAILELAYSSALRPRELYNLKITDIDFKKGLLFITQSKNKKDRIVPVGETALHWVRKYIEGVRPRYLKGKKHGYVFINHKTGEKLTRWGIRSAIQKTLRISRLQPIKPYSLRSTAATALLLNGMSIAYIGALLGHADIRTTQRYLRVKVNALKNELMRSHPRETFGKIQ